MKVQFKISRNQLIIWIGFLIATWDSEIRPDDISKRIDFLLLSSLLHKLKLQSVLIKDRYCFKLDAADALAFVKHAQNCNTAQIHAVDLILINQLIGIIDQKTK